MTKHDGIYSVHTKRLYFLFQVCRPVLARLSSVSVRRSSKWCAFVDVTGVTIVWFPTLCHKVPLALVPPLTDTDNFVPLNHIHHEHPQCTASAV